MSLICVSTHEVVAPLQRPVVCGNKYPCGVWYSESCYVIIVDPSKKSGSPRCEGAAGPMRPIEPCAHAAISSSGEELRYNARPHISTAHPNEQQTALTGLAVHLRIGALERDDAEEHEADEDAELERDPERRPGCVRGRTAHISLLGLSGRLAGEGGGLTVRGYTREEHRELRRVGVVGFAEVLVVGDVP